MELWPATDSTDKSLGHTAPAECRLTDFIARTQLWIFFSNLENSLGDVEPCLSCGNQVATALEDWDRCSVGAQDRWYPATQRGFSLLLPGNAQQLLCPFTNLPTYVHFHLLLMFCSSCICSPSCLCPLYSSV